VAPDHDPVDEVETRLAAVAEAAAGVLRRRDYRSMRVEEVAAAVALPGGRGRPSRRPAGRSSVWLYGEVRAKRVLAALAAAHAWQGFHAVDRSPRQTPATVVAAREMVIDAFAKIVRFCREEHFLMTQVRTGLGDLSQDRGSAGDGTVPAAWRHGGPYAAAAREAWYGRCAVFAGFLQGRLAQAVGAVAPPEVDEATAQHMSSLATYACIDDPYGSPETVAAGLAGYWFERYLTGRIGWVAAVEEAERQRDRQRRGDRAPRHLVSADGSLVGELIATNVLLNRAAAAAAAAAESITTLLAGPYASRSGEPGDATRDLLEAHCDITSRLGLALYRLGRYTEATRALEHSLAIADKELAHDRSRMARAQTNLADTFATSGDPVLALANAVEAVEVRRAIARELDTPTTWERLSLSENALVRCLLAAGRTGEAVRVARALLDDRLVHGSGSLAAHRTIGRALRVAGHPERARQHLRQAHQFDSRWYLPFSYTYQRTVLELARCARDLAQPAEVLALLDDSPALDPWFASQVSPALAVEVRLCRAEALCDSGDTAAAQLAVDEADRVVRDQLGTGHPLVLACRRANARLLARAGQTADAVGILLAVQSTEQGQLNPLDSGCITTRLSLAEIYARSGDRAAALAEVNEVINLVEHGVDPSSPAQLAARTAAARSDAEEERHDSALMWLQPVLDRRPVIDPSSGPNAAIDGWNLPALEEGHPLLLEARKLERSLRQLPSELTDTRGRPWWASEE